MGWMRVSGDAPDKLHWELGVRPGLHPLLEYVTGPDGVPLLVRSADETGGEDGVHDD
jgi:hypothetical protein